MRANPSGRRRSIAPEHFDSLWDEGSGFHPMSILPIGPGQAVGDYRLIERVGRGSQGEVWKAVKVVPRLKLSALKLLRWDLTHRPGRLDRFRREAEIGRRLVGPGLLSVEEDGEAGGTPYLVMPFVDGESLAAVIADRRRPTSPRVLAWWVELSEAEFFAALTRIVSQVARTLHRTHSQRLVHRDVKPANILLDRFDANHVFLADFGLGRDLDEHPSAGRSEAAATMDSADGNVDGDGARFGSGTPLYMAPEKLVGGDADEILCDVYSLGMTLFEALTLVHPVSVPSGLPRSCLASYLTQNTPARPRQIRPDLPASIESIILKATARDPADRYQHAGELADDLDSRTEGASGTGRPIAPTSPDVSHWTGAPASHRR
jgi:serine/threonine protein kinase